MRFTSIMRLISWIRPHGRETIRMFAQALCQQTLSGKLGVKSFESWTKKSGKIEEVMGRRKRSKEEKGGRIYKRKEEWCMKERKQDIRKNRGIIEERKENESQEKRRREERIYVRKKEEGYNKEERKNISKKNI